MSYKEIKTSNEKIKTDIRKNANESELKDWGKF